MKKPAQILFLFPSFAGKGGIQRFNRTLVHACSASGFRMTIMSVVDSDTELKSALNGVNIFASGAKEKRCWFAIKAMWLLATRRWDMVFVGHVNLVRFVSAILPWTRSCRARTMMVAHGVDVWGRLAGNTAAAVSKMWRVLAVSEYTRQSVLEQVPGLSNMRCVVFPNALSEIWKEQQGLKVRFDFDLPDKFVLSVTRLASTERYKGIVSAIESISNWEDKGISYVVVGGGDDLEFLKRVVLRCGVARRVTFLDAISDAELREIYRRAMMFLLPSGKEGFGIVFLEAMYFGVPVIAASSRGAVDVARENETAVLVRYGDVMGIAHAVDQIAGDASLRARIIAGGKALVIDEGEFTESAMRLRWRRLISEDS